MINFINKIGKYDKFNEMHEFIIKLVNDNLDTIQEHNQLAIQYATEPSWTNCMQPKQHKELEYCKTMPQLLDTPIDNFLNNIPYKLYRSRIMVLPAKGQCYSIHKDSVKRFHVPITTNEECYFISYEPHEIKHNNMIADGSTYIVDTRRTHTFFNDGKTLRIHLIGSVIS